MAELDLTPLRERLLEFGPRGRTALLPALHATQEMYGYIPEAAAAEVAAALHVPASEVAGVIDFYALFYKEPVARTIIHVCNDPACAMAGSESQFKLLSQQISQADGIPAVTLERAPCLGLCEHAPAVLVQGQPAVAGAQTWQELVAGRAPHPHSILGGSIRLLTANCGRGQPTTLAQYQAGDGYAGLRRALALSPAEVIAEVKTAGLVGRGGAAFPTAAKWEGAAAATGNPKYAICNADEAEPGTFKDRVLMEDDPHRILEGLIIAAYASGANEGFWYIRGEYHYPFQVVEAAVAEARQAGLLGRNILGSGFDFELELRQGAGAYICGEETALFESIEGKRGFPRLKPPFPTTHGLFGKPTVINNVETLSNVPLILSGGAAAYRSIGTSKSPGPKLFCLSGDVQRPGLYEVPFGTPFRELLENLAGGLRPGRSFQAALFGGASGAFATPAQLDVRLSFEDLRAAGLPLGSGVITIFDDRRDLRDILAPLAFLRRGILWQMLPLPDRHPAPARDHLPPGRGQGLAGRRGAPAGRGLDDDRRLAVRPGSDGRLSRPECDQKLAAAVRD
jgi:NADH-quinone oxidoreductase subunit F